jgi:hypothetical protein
MIKDKIKFDFNQIRYGLEAFMGNIQLQLQNIIKDLPVFIIQSGDMSYLFHEKFIENEEKEIYLKVPRFLVDFDDIQFQQDQLSNMYNRLTYLYEGKNYETTCRRIPLLIPVNTNFVCSNFITYLENFEVMTTISSRDNPFTYEFCGSTYEASYGLQNPSSERPSMDVSSATRDYNIKTVFELQLHIIIPRINSIREYSDEPYKIHMDIESQKPEKSDASDYKSVLDIDLNNSELNKRINKKLKDLGK